MPESLLPIEIDALGQECLRCEDCGRLVAARPSAYQLHHNVTCAMYREAQALVTEERLQALYEPFWTVTA